MSDLREDLTSKLLGYYRDSVAPALILLYSIDGAFPDAILNEIRNAFTHLSRAHAEGLDESEIAAEIAKARAHLFRVHIDCAKTCLLTLGERLQERLSYLDSKLTAIPNSILQRASDCRKERLRLLAQDTNGPTDTLVDDMFALVEAYSDLLDSIRKDYGDEFAVAYKARERRRRLIDVGIGLGLGIVASIAAALVLSAFGIG